MILRGIDTLHFGLDFSDYEKFNPFLSHISKLKLIGIQSSIPQKIKLGDLSLQIELSGARFYSYRLTCNDFTILFASKVLQENPPVRVEFSSGFLWSYGHEGAYKRFLEWFFIAFGMLPLTTRISRLDMCCDTDLYGFRPDDVSGFVTYSKSRSCHYDNPVDNEHYSGRVFTGLTIGRGKPVLCRIYDKTEEVKKSAKLWFHEIWKENEWNGKPVWRVEFQMRREILKEFGISSVDDAFESLHSIWAYLTENWLSLRSPDAGKKVTDWKISRKWCCIAHDGIMYSGSPAVRSKVKEGNLDRLLDQGSGILLSVASKIDAMDADACFDMLTGRLHDRLRDKGKTFEQAKQERLQQYV